MKTNYTIRVLLILVIGLILYALSVTRCSREKNDVMPRVEIIRDTIWQNKIDTIKIETVKYKTVYIPKYVEKEKPIVVYEEEDIEEQYAYLYDEAKVYQDTISNQDFDLYTKSIVKGELIDSEISYKLKVPRTITERKTIHYPSVSKSHIYTFGEIGGNKTQFDNISIGMLYNHKSNWFASYSVNLIELNNITHNIGLGFRLK